MESGFKHISALIGDPVRSEILWMLLDGRAYTASELALGADVSQQNASMHLGKLVQADILTVEKQGRHRYYKFSRDEVAYAVEALANLVPKHGSEKHEVVTGIKYCRTCYDHLAGRVAVLLTERLLKDGILCSGTNEFGVTPQGEKWFAQLKIDTEKLKTHKRQFARKCLDWTERRHHLAGALGAALLEEMLKADWVRRIRNSREILVTPKGQEAIYRLLKLSV